MTPTTNTTPGPLYGKKILSFEECAAALSASAKKKKKIRKQIATSSPFAIKTRGLILKPHEEAKAPAHRRRSSPAPSSPAVTPRLLPRRPPNSSAQKSRRKIPVPPSAAGVTTTPTRQALASRQVLDFKTPSKMLLVKSAQQGENAKPSDDDSTTCHNKKIGKTDGTSGCSKAHPLSTPPLAPHTLSSRKKHPKSSSLPSKMTTNDVGGKPNRRTPLARRQEGL